MAYLSSSRSSAVPEGCHSTTLPRISRRCNAKRIATIFPTQRRNFLGNTVASHNWSDRKLCCRDTISERAAKFPRISRRCNAKHIATIFPTWRRNFLGNTVASHNLFIYYLKATPTFTLTTPIFDQRWPTLIAPPGPLLYVRAAIRLVLSQKR